MRGILGLVATVLIATAPGGITLAETVVLEPVKDNTLYETNDGSLSNGAGSFLFAGVTMRSETRRALLAFDVAGNVPAGATVNAVGLTLAHSMTSTVSQPVALHRALADWGEGTSRAASGEGAGAPAETGDATWIHTFFDGATWTNAGGDFAAAPSASQSVAGLGDYTWGSTAEMVADVQTWLDDPHANFGWILIGNESDATTVRRFGSREGAAAARPMLRVDFELAEETATPTETTAVPTPTSSPPSSPTATRTTTDGACVGDCDGNGRVAINEIVTGVNIGLETLTLSACVAFDPDGSGTMAVNEIIQGVNNGLSGCP